ncbi:MAG: hypothetical protein CVU65_03260 [Deltaproteobacteria bacterium HGW-Deltaproteobacteria-22]|jgi:hypothetical protein|nr:MAG: hypothetical protein CVU65_03260 [Deltaproteobacteria bacterium HGW-Deltaproteobacteria-22]
MKTSFHLVFRILTIALIAAAVSFSWACIERPMKVADPAPNVISDFSALQSTTRDVDLIFLVDTSRSMEDEQILLRQNFPNLVRVLKDISGGLPNLHLGTISPDLGTAPYNSAGCDRPNGDDGRFMKGAGNACVNPVNQNFVVDVEPRGCTIEKLTADGETTTCPSHDCAQANCEQAAFTDLEGTPSEPAGLVLAMDENGCPRCRNYSGESLEDVFSCMADLGIAGCGLESQLEAVYRAVTDRSGANEGFWRENAYLAIFIISDEDDCSVKNTEFYNPIGDINSTLGKLDNFRCTEFGVKCDESWQRVMPAGSMTYHNCAPREANDPLNMLQPVDRYTSMLRQLKDANMILVGAIVGPYGNQLTIGLDVTNYPKMEPSCGVAPNGADPAVRINAFVEEMLLDEDDVSWALTSICSGDYSAALVGLGNRIKEMVEVQCITTPLAGCPDPAAANGALPLTHLPSEDAGVCTPLCAVQDIDADGNVTEIPQCPVDYQGGHPAKRDQSLPVAKCFHVTFNPECAVPCPENSTLRGCDPVNTPWYGPSRGAEIIISRRADPTPGTRAKIACAGLPLTEKLCFDGKDNDVDGLIDGHDPDCSN